MVSLFEPEETVGQAWHRLVGGSGSYRRHADAAVELDGIRTGLGVMFRALGGAGGVRLAACGPAASGHRLGLLQRIGLGTEKVDMARFDGATLELPARIDCFPDRADNEALYEWLVAWFACAEPVHVPEDPCRPMSPGCASRPPRPRSRSPPGPAWEAARAAVPGHAGCPPGA